ncbi:DUF485 domain-containing protein [Limisalsivibrio acetivorans]|uniref:DUF485 domain-containing protein n=1 Tax=Limisalsivibrio acetivorans TaxID=1304888 RepID=UPI0003B5558A|nr:DUF485 domain-containing protein [Limisalsivibrio acetivorans]
MDAKELTNSDKFKSLVKKRWTFSFIMLAVLFFMYYGFVFTVAGNKDFMVKPFTENITVGVVFATGVIIGAWFLTIIYVIWANKVYDKDVKELIKMID